MQKQFKQPNIRRETGQKKEEGVSPGTVMNGPPVNFSDGSQLIPHMENQPEQSNTTDIKRVSVHDRLRIPVSYDDNLLGEDPGNEAA